MDGHPLSKDANRIRQARSTSPFESNQSDADRYTENEWLIARTMEIAVYYRPGLVKYKQTPKKILEKTVKGVFTWYGVGWKSETGRARTFLRGEIGVKLR
jgi:hypothetical protein